MATIHLKIITYCAVLFPLLVACQKDANDPTNTNNTNTNTNNNNNPPSTTPSFTLKVNGKTNCIFLNSSVAASKNIPAGTYNTQVTGNAFFAPSASHGNVFLRYAGTDDDHLEMLTIGASKSLSLRTADKVYAFFADWQSVSDNSGDITIAFGTNTLSVNGSTNCVLLDNSVAAKLVVPAGTYRVVVTGNAYFSPGASHRTVFVRYPGSDDDHLDMLTIGAEKVIKLRAGNGFYAFFADWNSIDDNSGDITIEFYAQ